LSSELTAVVLAGGLGTRLGAAAGGRPKALALIDGRPFLDILVGELVRAGVVQVVVAVGHLREAVMGYLGDQVAGMAVRYSVEERPLGTGGAIGQALDNVETDHVAVLNGDTFCGVDLQAMASAHRRGSSALTMAVCAVPDVSRFGAVTIEDGIATGFGEKSRRGPGWINAGSYVIDRTIGDSLDRPGPFSFEQEVLRFRVQQEGVPVFTAPGPFIDIGTPEDLLLAQTVLARGVRAPLLAGAGR
jgi:NDP-sugar pyrophosphorylase family protein